MFISWDTIQKVNNNQYQNKYSWTTIQSMSDSV